MFRKLVLTVGAILCLVLILVYQNNQLFGENHDKHLRELRKPQHVAQTLDIKYILYWTPMLSSKIWYFPDTGGKIFQGCKFSNCYATMNRNLIPVEDFAAVLFYTPGSNDMAKKGDRPRKRSRHQRYVFGNSESPLSFDSRTNGYLWRNFYNWTMTYRLDSDILRPHGFLVNATEKYEMPSEEFVRQKTRSVAWFVSRCSSHSKRFLIVKQLQKYIDVDIYGKCGKLKCYNRTKCYDMLEHKYKFYLSFENSLCKDYATEKFYNVLRKNVIPVVYGAADYQKMAPPHSFINVLDFENVKSLADYLKALSENATRYLEYFEWKKTIYVDTHTKTILCQLCDKLNDPNEPEKVYPNIKEWWFGRKTAQCTTAKQLLTTTLKKFLYR